MSPRAAGAVAFVLAGVLGLAGCPRHVRNRTALPASHGGEPAGAGADPAGAGPHAERTGAGDQLDGRRSCEGDRAGSGERPGRLRLEAEVTLQGTVAVLATDGVRFAFLDTRQNELRRGPACPANVASLIRIPLAPPEVAAILLGDGPPVAAAAADDDQVSWDGDLGADVLDMAARSGNDRVRYAVKQLDSRLQIVSITTVAPTSVPIWRVAFEDFTDVRPSTSPTAPSLFSPRPSTSPKATLPSTRASRSTSRTAPSTTPARPKPSP